MKTCKKALSLVLVIAMVFSLCVIGANAEGTTLPNADTNGVITLTENVTLAAPVVINNNVTLDLNGHNITGNNCRVFEVAGGTLKLSGSGVVSSTFSSVSTCSVIKVSSTVSAAELVVGKDVTVTSDTCYGITLLGSTNTKSLTVNGKVICNSTKSHDGSAIAGNGTTANANTEITINSGAVVTSTNDAAIYHPQAGTLTINGGTITGTTALELKSGAATVSISGDSKLIATASTTNHTANSDGSSSSGYAVAVVDNAGYAGEASATINGGCFTGPVAILDDDNNPNNNTGIISITGGTFSDMSWAPYAVNGASVKLGANVTLSSPITTNKNITIDLANFTITGSNSRVFVVAGGTLNLSGRGTVCSNFTSASDSSVIKVSSTDGAAELVVGKDVTVTSDSCYGVTLLGSTNTKSLTVNGTVICNSTRSHDGSAIAGNGTAANANTVITINSGAVVTSKYDAAIYHPQAGTLTINGGTITGTTALELKSGAATVAISGDSKLIATAATTNHTANGNGSSSSGYAVAVVDNAGYAGEASATINGGCFTGPVAILDDDNNPDNNTGIISITGGYFTSDPSAYVAAGYLAQPTALSGYNFEVVEKVKTDVEVAAAEPVIAKPNTDTPEYVVYEALIDNPPDVSGLEGAAGAVAQNETTTAEQGAAKLQEKYREMTPPPATSPTVDNVTIYVEPYLDIEVKDANLDSGEITLDIKPMVKTVASTANTAEGIKDNNSVQIGEAEPLIVNTPVTISFTVAESSFTGPLQIKHVKDNGDTYYYDATVSGVAPQVITFTVTHGFSEFTTMSADPRTLTVNYDSNILPENYVITDVGAPLPVASKAGYRFDGWKFAGAVGTYQTLTSALWNQLFPKVDTTDITVAAVAQFTYLGGVGGDGATTSKEYTLTFNTNGGSSIASITKASGTVINLASYTPTREGYDFAGWYSDAALTNEVKSVELKANTTVYAKWTETEKKTDEPTAPVCPFTDVTEADFYYNAVLWAVDKGVTTGKSSTLFAPMDNCTRAEVVTFLWRAMGCPEPTATTCPFTDVAEDAYYYKAVMWAVEKGVTTGTSDTTFTPDKTVTRAEFVTFLWRASSSPVSTATNPFADMTDTNAFYYNAVLWAVENGITTGTTATTFGPADPCTRGQVVTFLYRGLVK